jgi:hypothetical protein
MTDPERTPCGIDGQPSPVVRTVIVTKKAFGFTLNELKKNGYRYNPATKTWSGTVYLPYIFENGYVLPVFPQPAEEPTE